MGLLSVRPSGSLLSSAFSQCLGKEPDPGTLLPPACARSHWLGSATVAFDPTVQSSPWKPALRQFVRLSVFLFRASSASFLSYLWFNLFKTLVYLFSGLRCRYLSISSKREFSFLVPFSPSYLEVIIPKEAMTSPCANFKLDVFQKQNGFKKF